MKTFLRHTAILLFHLGGFGLLILGILDSSFLTMPLGNDLLVVALTASHHGRLPYYAAMATAGSVIGCFIIDLIFRKGGKEGLEKHVAAKRLQYIEDKVKKRAIWALTMASLMPPPFPFTPFVAGAAAFQYPRKRLLTIIGVSRFVRFGVEGVLAIYFGQRILKLAETPAVQWGIVALIVLSIGGSAFSIYRWIKRSRQQPQSRPQDSRPSKQAA